MQTHQERISIKLDHEVATRYGLREAEIVVDAEREGATYSFPAKAIPGPSSLLSGGSINGMQWATTLLKLAADEDPNGGTIILANVNTAGRDPTPALMAEMRRLQT